MCFCRVDSCWDSALLCYRLKTLNHPRLMGHHSEARTSVVAPGLLKVNWWLRKLSDKEKQLGRSSGLGQILRGGYGCFESIFVLECKGTSCFSSVSQKDRQ